MNRGNSSVFSWAALGMAVVLSFLIRCLPYANFVNPDGGFYFYSIDSYDHLRRITLGIHLFPALADFDYYAAFPHGLGQIWSPGFDYILSFICYLAGGGRIATESICFFVNPLMAAAAVVCIFFVARGMFRSEVAAVVASIVLAVSPAAIVYSLPMNFDHHVIEPLVALCLLALPILEVNGKLSWRGIVIVAGALLLSIIFWRGSTLYWGLAFFSALVRVYASDNRLLAKSYAIAFGFAAGIVSVYCLADPWGGAGQLSFAVISWFHSGVLFAASGILILFSLSPSRKVFLIWLGCLAGASAVLFYGGLMAEVVGQFFKGLSFVRGKGDPWFDINSELRGVFQSRYSLWYSATYLTAFWFLAPVAVWLGIRKWLRGGQDLLLLNFCMWAPVLVMGFTLRYSHVAAVFASLSAGFLGHHLWFAYCRPRQRYALVIFFVVLLLPGIPHYQEAMSADLPSPIKSGLYGVDGLIPWIRNHTPPTSYWLDPKQKPEYGVLARWSLGARLYQDAQRPSLSTAFGWETRGFYEEAGFWVTEDESKAMSLLATGPIRYVVVQAVHDLKADYNVASQGQKEGGLPSGIVSAHFRPELSMQKRLVQGDGSMMKVSGGEILPALERLRMVYESRYLISGGDGKPLDLSYYKLFEAVPGAVIKGLAADGEQVVVSLDLETGRGRRLSYLARAYADSGGNFTLRVPYSTEGKQGDTVPLGRYVVYVGRERRGEVTVSEDDVAVGRVVRFK